MSITIGEERDGVLRILLRVQLCWETNWETLEKSLRQPSSPFPHE